MVKKYFLLLLFPIVIGCNEKVIEQMDEIIIHKNYLKPDTIPFDISKMFLKLSIDTFDARIIRKKLKLNEIKGFQKQFLLSKYVKCVDEFHRNTDGEDYISKFKKNERTDSYELYTIGTIIINKNIVSYIILMRSLNTLNKIPFNSIILFNTRKNILYSTVELANGFENSENLPPVLQTYKIGDNFLTVQEPIYPNMVNDYSFMRIKSWDDFLITFGIKDEYKTVVNYSVFYIDNAGYLRFGKINAIMYQML